MKNGKKIFTVFEHEKLSVKDKNEHGIVFTAEMRKLFEAYYGDKGVPYFTLINNGIRFNEFVGVLQVGDVIIEILPKADNNYKGKDEKNHWRDILIDMLYAVGIFDIHAPSSSALKLKSNSILDLYFELFIKEAEYLLHSGLIKKYRKKEGNVHALKGSLQFGKHIQLNITHEERFYVKYTSYDACHVLHQVIFKTITLLKAINTNTELQSRIGALMLNFPEMPFIKVTEATFNKIVYDRKSFAYKPCIEIARLLLLQYHPDVSNGRDNVLALMFDMNVLWEKFVYMSLRKHKSFFGLVKPQISKDFWKPEPGRRVQMRADIVIKKNKGNCIVLDTKWKNLNGYNPSPDDLRQMYVYHEYYEAHKVALVYPGSVTKETSGSFYSLSEASTASKDCSVVLISAPGSESESKIVVREWQKKIGQQFERWIC